MYNEQIPTLDDLTPDWFTRLLQSSGDLADDVNVTTATVVPFGHDESMMSSLSRVALTYDSSTSAPDALIVKLASQAEAQRFVAEMFKFYEREIRFYSEILPGLALRAPTCFRAEINPASPDFVLVLEEVTGMRPVDQIGGVGFDDALACVETLADMHAPFWGTDMSPIAETFFEYDHPIMQAVVPDHVFAEWKQARDQAIDVLADEIVAIYDKFPTVCPELLAGMQGPDTLVHGDFRSDNLLFDADGRPLVLDFQLVTIGNGMVDVAYFISQSVADDVAAARADELIDAYLARLATHGIDVDRDDAMRHYRSAAIFLLSIPISVLATAADRPERGVDLASVMLRRGGAEILRTDAHLQHAAD